MDTLRCSAGWYELNISAPGDEVSACCYYRGAKEAWLDEYKELRAYWNSPQMQYLRSLNSGREVSAKKPNGCIDCDYYKNKAAGTPYYDFAHLPGDLDARQRENWIAAQADFAAGRVEVSALPLRIYANFGFGCNLTCGACIQVPHRKHNRRQVFSDLIFRWREEFRALLDFSIIGGEPFALPEGLKFIRRFVADELLAPVRLSIFSNGSVHHKHYEMLGQKEKVSLTISLDSIGEAYEKLRPGGSWSLVERNMLGFLERARSDRPQWQLYTNAMVTKTGIARLPEFARWHVRHQVQTWFYDFISTPGNEDVYSTENILRYPQQLDDMPEWRDRINEAIALFDEGKRSIEATSLRHYLGRLEQAVAESAGARRVFAAAAGVQHWQAQARWGSAQDLAGSLISSSTEPAGKPLALTPEGALVFVQTRVGDSAGTPVVSLKPMGEAAMARVTLRWRRRSPEIRRAHVALQDARRRLRETFRQTTEDAAATQTVIVYRLEGEEVSLRLMASPTGEDASALPDEILLESCHAETFEDDPVRDLTRRVKARLRAHPVAGKVIRLLAR